MQQKQNLFFLNLGVYINENLNWETPINEISTKLIKSNAVLSKFWDFINTDILLSVCYDFFFTRIQLISVQFGVKLNII